MKAVFGLLLSAVLLVVFNLFVTNGFVLLEKAPQAMDFLAFYTGAFLLSHDPSHLYHLPTQLALQHQLLPVTKSLDIFLPFLNPPFVALLLSPLSYVPITIAYALWTAFNILLMVGICFIVWKQLASFSKLIKILSILGIITFIPILTSLLIGQLTFIMLLLFLLVWICLKKGWLFRSGLLLSLVLIKPHFILLPILAFAVQRRWKMLLGMLTGIVVLAAVSFAAVGWQGMSDYFQLLTSASGWSSGYGIDIKAQHSLQTVLLILTNENTLSNIRILWFVSLAIIILPTLYLWRRRYPLNSPEFSLQYALLLLATLLTSPHTHFHDLTLLIVIGIAVGYAVHKTKRQHIFANFILLGYFVSLSGYLIELYLISSSRQGWIIVMVGYLLIFWGFIAKSLMRK